MCPLFVGNVTVKKFVQARSAGQLIRQGNYERRPKATDKYVAVIEEAVDRSKARSLLSNPRHSSR